MLLFAPDIPHEDVVVPDSFRGVAQRVLSMPEAMADLLGAVVKAGREANREGRRHGAENGRNCGLQGFG